MNEGGLAINSLNNKDGDSEEARKKDFEDHAAAFMSLLEFISVSLQRQIRALDADSSIAPSGMAVKSDFPSRQKTVELWKKAAELIKRGNA